MRAWTSAAVILLDASVWLGLVWLSFAVHQSLGAPHWSLPTFLVPATLFLWLRIGTTVSELVAVLFFLFGAAAFFLVGASVFQVTPGLPDIIAYAICGGASLAGFRTWQSAETPREGTAS